MVNKGSTRPWASTRFALEEDLRRSQTISADRLPSFIAGYEPSLKTGIGPLKTLSGALLVTKDLVTWCFGSSTTSRRRSRVIMYINQAIIYSVRR